MVPPREFASVLEQVHEATLATVRPDGWPQATVVSFVNEDDRVWFECLKTSQKSKNHALDSRVSLTVMIPYLPWGDIWGFSFSGHARMLTTAEELSKVKARWLARFPYMSEVLDHNLPDFNFYEVRPETVVRMDYRRGLGQGNKPRRFGPEGKLLSQQNVAGEG